MADATDTRPLELEIKLAGDAPALKAAFRAVGAGEETAKAVTSIYFDTADQRLWRKGYTLRLREKSAGHELTLKTEGASQMVRGEWSVLIDEPVPDPGYLPRGVPRTELGLILPEELSEQHRTEAKRTKKLVERDGAVIEVSLDQGVIRAGDREMPVAELELEVLRGDLSAALKTAEELLSDGKLALETRSKAGRGMALALDAAPSWHKATRPELDLSDSVDTTIARILRITVAQVQANMAAAADGRDVEGVHQLRVALRRLRSAFSIFGDRIGDEVEGLNEQARHILRALGPARDIDVFINETLPPVLAEHSEARGLAQLAERAAAEREAAYETVRAQCHDPAFSHFIVRLLLLADRLDARQQKDVPLQRFAEGILKRRRKKALKKGRGFDTMPTAQRHEVRISLKKLRYAIDFFRSLYPREDVAPFRRELKALQDDFGTMNDAAVAEVIAAQLADGYVEAMMGAALVSGWYAHRLKAVEPHMIQAWDNFCAAEPFWKK